MVIINYGGNMEKIKNKVKQNIVKGKSEKTLTENLDIKENKELIKVQKKTETEPVVKITASEEALVETTVLDLLDEALSDKVLPENKVEAEVSPVKRKRKASGGSNRNCQISQYTMSGKLIRTFPSIKDAVMAMEITEKTILEYINGKRYQTGGYMWGYERDCLNLR